MSRVLIDHYSAVFEAAYRTDPFHAFRANLAAASPDEWNVRPSDWSREEFGDRPELSIGDLAHHVGGALVMYTDRAFGEAKLDWGDIRGPASADMDPVLAWLDEAHATFAAGIASLTDDVQLAEMRQAPWRTPMPRAQLIGLMVNHQIYHSGEVNRQRSLIRGTSGWDR